MGVANAVSRSGYSAYELYGLDGCFSHMKHEQLVNWVLCGAAYYEKTADLEWLDANLEVFEKCLSSMLNRDDADPEGRNGIMGLDSSRTMSGAEITTYDSLDVSLAETAGSQAEKCASTITRHVTSVGYIPAVIGENNDSKIIPAIEGLIFPYVTGNLAALEPNGRFGAYLEALNTHLRYILRPGICLFEGSKYYPRGVTSILWLEEGKGRA